MVFKRDDFLHHEQFDVMRIGIQVNVLPLIRQSVVLLSFLRARRLSTPAAGIVLARS